MKTFFGKSDGLVCSATFPQTFAKIYSLIPPMFLLVKSPFLKVSCKTKRNAECKKCKTNIF